MLTNFSFASNVSLCSDTLSILKIYSTRNVNYRFSKLALYIGSHISRTKFGRSI